MEAIGLFIFFAIQTGALGFLLSLRLQSKALSVTTVLMGVTGLFLIFNSLIINDLIRSLPELGIVILPAFTFLYYSFRIKQNRVSRRKRAVIFLLMLLIIVAAILVILFSKDFQLPVLAPLIVAISIALGAVISINLKLSISDKIHHVSIVMAGVGITTGLLAGLFLLSKSLQTIYLIPNFSYLIVIFEFIASFHKEIIKAEKQEIAADQSGDPTPAKSANYKSLDDFGLTELQKLVARDLLNGLTYQEIANRHERSEESTRRLATRMYHRTGTKTPGLFIVTFLPEHLELKDKN